MNELMQEFCFSKSNQMDIEGAAKSLTFGKFVYHSTALQVVNLLALTPIQLKCFFINLYNCLAFQTYILLGSPKTPLKRSIFFNKSKYEIGTLKFSLNIIEHGILRGNKPLPIKSTKQFITKKRRC